jgi:L-ribulose-5-phosphate 4-epimerase
MNEGIIKFKISKWHKTGALDDNIWHDLEAVRKKLFSLKLIGFDEKLKLGYGNISKRLDGDSFIITASRTKHIPDLTGENYSVINKADLKANSVECTGPAEPSSESITHAACYYSNPFINTVIHIHSEKIWKKMIDDGYPTTPPEAEYGSILLSEKISDAVKNLSMGKPFSIVMKGHENGVIITGTNLNSTLRYVFELYEMVLKSSLKNSLWGK